MGEFKTFKYDGELKVSPADDAVLLDATEKLMAQDREGAALVKQATAAAASRLRRQARPVVKPDRGVPGATAFALAAKPSSPTAAAIFKASLPAVYAFLKARQAKIGAPDYETVLTFDKAAGNLKTARRLTAVGQAVLTGMENIVIADYPRERLVKTGRAIVADRSRYLANAGSPFGQALMAVMAKMTELGPDRKVPGLFIHGPGVSPQRCLAMAVGVAAIVQRRKTAVLGPQGLLTQAWQAAGKNRNLEDSVKTAGEVPFLALAELDRFPRANSFVEKALLPLLAARAAKGKFTLITAAANPMETAKLLGFGAERQGLLYKALRDDYTELAVVDVGI